jgi:hypothetical protein
MYTFDNKKPGSSPGFLLLSGAYLDAQCLLTQVAQHITHTISN